MEAHHRGVEEARAAAESGSERAANNSNYHLEDNNNTLPSSSASSIPPQLTIQATVPSSGADVDADGGAAALAAGVSGLAVSTSGSTPSPSGSTPGSATAKLCRFFGQGTCRNGANCRFSHDPSTAAAPASSPYGHGQQQNRHYYQSPYSKPPSPGGSRGGGGAGSGSPAAVAAPILAPPATTAAGPPPSSPSPSFQPHQQQSLPPPFPNPIVRIPAGHPIFSVDVECVATGVQHNARAIAQVAVVDEYGRPVFNVYVKQELPVVSYITELTGLTAEIIEKHGRTQAEALAMLREAVPSQSILVGQNILKDVQWLQLVRDYDYHDLVDISSLFRVWNGREYITFSQDHVARVVLGIEPRPHHNAMDDAAISMSLFAAYRSLQWDPMRLYEMQMATLAAPRVLGFSSRFPVVDGCCMGNRKKCSCGAPFF